MLRPWLALVLALAACSSPGEAREPSATTAVPTSTTTMSTLPPPPPVVAALGDSNLFEVLDVLPTQLVGLDLRPHAVIGLETREGHFGLRGLLEAEPDALLVVLGTNDALDGNLTGEEVASIDELAGQFETVPCVRWVDVVTTASSPSVNEDGRRWNEALDAASSRHDFGVVRWSTEVAAHPEWMREDGIHHTEPGRQAFAALLAAAVQGCLAQLPAEELVPERGERSRSTPGDGAVGR